MYFFKSSFTFSAVKHQVSKQSSLFCVVFLLWKNEPTRIASLSHRITSATLIILPHIGNGKICALFLWVQHFENAKNSTTISSFESSNDVVKEVLSILFKVSHCFHFVILFKIGKILENCSFLSSIHIRVHIFPHTVYCSLGNFFHSAEKKNTFTKRSTWFLNSNIMWQFSALHICFRSRGSHTTRPL